ncbi:gfo/Idh/MocA family oxidoreductase [Paenibacillus sp. HJL G12]|uniref:Gfo/Idh/MocA family oxidoreductase n=1 Tax=Paenibacillus dendrobii TaxID=2691084 RepID=A0A7X3IHB0_9BACL|nr:Gfo/Idh/MocA family oxidoreductase [Paenibacillus dendrobii]MWV42077.1 gfo/Idh/MocA family oxidoreductase [Paenibacillus dendrobii]
MIKIGVVGAGIIAAEHMKHIHQNDRAELTAVCDVAPGAAELAVKQYGGNAYTHFDEMLDREKLDALFICVPPFAHGDMEEKAAERGIHLLVEKPLGLSMDEVRRKAEILEKSGILTGSGYCLRYMESVQRAKRYLEGKEIAMVRAYRFGGLPPNIWWVDHAKSGGQLVEQTTHNLDLMMYLAGDVRRISADMALKLMRDVPGITTPDAASVNMVFDSGALGHIDTGFFPQPDGRASLEVMGRNFRLTLEGKDLTILENEQTTIIRGKGDFYQAQDDAFIRAVETGDRSLILAPYSEALRTLEVSLAANESAQSGQPVSFF